MPTANANHRRLGLAFLWLLLLLSGHWYHDAGAEPAAFLNDPALNLANSPLPSLLAAAIGLTGLALLQERAALLFAPRSWWPALWLASLLTLLSPFQLSTGLLFATLLIAASALLSLLGQRRPAAFLATADGVRGIFFISGMAALIYQVTWQKKLFSLLGADGQSVTVIVAVFLGGLGVGALLGDKLAPRLTPRQGIRAFCLVEVAAGLFGAVSIYWLEWVGLLAGDAFSPWVMIGATALAVGLPTILMGMTLPLLVEALQSGSPGLHHNVGKLYAINALGSAVASLLAATLLFTLTGLIGATWLAAALNGLTALLVWFAGSRWPDAPPAGSAERASATLSTGPLSWPRAALLAAATGFISIGLEVLLLRMMGWSTAGRPWTFGIGVGAFLLGLCLGSLRQAQLPARQLADHGRDLWLGTALATLLLPALAALLGAASDPTAGAIALAGCLGVCGWLGGCSLPLIAGQIKANRHGKYHFGAVYAANIIGSVAGAIGTGYFLFDHLSAVSCLLLFTLLSLLVTAAFAILAGAWRLPHWLSDKPLLSSSALALAVLLAGWSYPQWREFLYQGKLTPTAFSFAKESRGGIIAVQPDADGDMVIGGGAYDGRLNVDPERNSNLISRTYITMAMHPAPRQVLQIGLASGSWAKAMLSFPGVETLHSIDINAAYLDLIAQAPLVADILHDPRAHYTVADGRKWLHAHSERWDLIVINNTFHWREGATLLHSREFMSLARSRLHENGLLFLNTTGARSISATALSVFPEVYQVSNGIVAVNGHLPPLDVAQLGQRLAQSSLFAAQGLDASRAIAWLAGQMPQRLDAAAYRQCTILSDDAMAAEWGKATCSPARK